VASYEAIINLVVQGEAALNRIQKKIDNLYKTVGDLETKKKFKGSQAAADFVREQADELERVVSVSKKQIKEQERSIVKQSKLNAAVDLYERRQRQLSRTSVANQKQFADQIKDIEEGFKFFKDRKSATGVQAIATELGRIIEYDNEINRISERRTANQRKLFSFTKEVAKYEAFGLRADRARESLSKFEKVAGSNQLKKAQQYEAALRNQLKLLKDQLVEQQRVAKIAPSSPVLGSVNFPGSPRAIAAQQRAQEIALRQSQRGFPASPIGGTATMPGSPKFLATQERVRSAAERALRAQERAAKAAENAANKEADRILKESQKGFPSSPIMGTATMAGSPRAIAAQERNRVAAERRAATQRRAEERAAKVQQQVAIAAERAADKALKEAQKGFPSSPVLGSATIEGSPRWKAAQESARQKLESAARAAERAADRALKEAQKGFPSSPILGTATMVGSPRWRAAQERAARMAGGGVATGSGLEQALQGLQEARGARQTFLGDVSPAEAIDKIVREFNTGKPGKGIGEVADNITESYASRIKAGIPTAAAAMRDLGVAGITAIKKALKIQSPSRVMLEIAKNQIDTYVDFLRAALPQVEAAAKAIGEAGTPAISGVPESAIRKPITERARTRQNTAQDLERNSVIAEYAASQIAGPTGQFESVKRKIEDFIDKTRTFVDLDKLFGGQEDERFRMATRGISAGPEFDKARAALADFYQVPAELTPGLERGVKAASNASADGDQLKRYVADLASGLEQIGQLLQSAAKLPTPTAVVDTEFTRAQQEAARIDAAAAEAAQKKAEAQQPFEASIQRAAELDAEAKRKADAAVSSVVQAQIEADARAGAEAISKSILDPIESTAPEGERQVRSAIGNLFDRVAGALGFGGGGGGRPPVPPTGGGGPTRDPGDFNRRLSSAAEQGAEALLGLQELREPAKATTVELEALSAVLKEFRNVLDPTVAGFDKLDKQLRETAAGLDRQLERRAPDADFLTRRFGPRGGRAVSEGLIGGAFPLLFGQGIGAAAVGGIGGALGGFAGGGLGFGLSLVGTALGTAFDTTVQSAIDLGKALEDPIKNFQALADRSLVSSKALEKQIEKTIEAGDTATAYVLIQQDLIKTLGSDGAAKLKAAAEVSDRLNRAWAELSSAIQAAIAGPLAGFLEWVNSLVNAAGRRPKQEKDIRETFKQLPDNYQQEFNKEVQKRISAISIAAPASKAQPGFGLLQGVDNGLPRQQGMFDNAITSLEIEPIISLQAIQDIRVQVAKEFQDKKIPIAIELKKEQKWETQIAALQKQLEGIDLGESLAQQTRAANREQKDLDKQRADLVRSYEENIASIRKSVEDKIAQQRIENARLEIELKARGADLELAKIKAANQEFRGLFSDTLAGDVTNRVLDAVESITQSQNQAAAQRAELELSVQNSALEVEKFKIDVAKQVTKLNEESIRQVDGINQGIIRRNEDANERRFLVEKAIAILRLRQGEAQAKQDLKLAEETLKNQKGGANEQFFTSILNLRKETVDIFTSGLKSIESLKPPGKLREMPQFAGASVSTAGVSELNQVANNTQKAIQEIGQQITGIAEAQDLKNITYSLDKQIKQADLLFFEFEQGGGARSKDLAAQANLIDAIRAKIGEQKDAMSPLAQKLKELLQFEDGRYKIITLINQAQAANTQTQALEDLIAKEKELKIAIQGAGQANGELLEVDKVKLLLAKQGVDLENDKAQALLNQATIVDELNAKYKKLTADQQMQKELLDGIAGTFANTVSGAIDMAVSGTENFGEALKGLAADMLKIIARMLIMHAIAQVLGALGGNDKNGFFSTLARGFGYKESANGSYFANGIAAFANGGMFTNSIVSSPTLFRFADGGALSTGVMGEAGPEAIMPLKRGPGGRLGVDASGSGSDNITVTVNVDAKGTSVQGNDQQGNQLGRAISAAVQQELIKQKRPGGLLA
jgi:hypothetical protein